MDKAKKYEIVKNLKKMLSNKEMKKYIETNKDIVMIAKQILGNVNGIMDINDSFNFDESTCLKCDKHCCMISTTIRVSPAELEYFMRSKLFEGKQRKEVVDQYLDLYLGSNSRIPIATVKFMKIPGTKIPICPFSIMMLAGSIKNGNLKINSVNGACMLGQEYKPNVCMLYPLGRLSVGEMKGEELPEWIYFHAEHCQCTKTNKEMKIMDFVRNLDEKTWLDKEYYVTMNNLKNKIVEVAKSHGDYNPDKGIDYIMSIWLDVFYYQDGDTMAKIEKVKQFISMLDEEMAKAEPKKEEIKEVK